MNIYENLRKMRENLGKMGYTTQLLTAQVCITGTKLMLRQSSSSLVKYVKYLIDSFHIVSAHAPNSLVPRYLREITREGATCIRLPYITQWNMEND